MAPPYFGVRSRSQTLCNTLRGADTHVIENDAEQRRRTVTRI